MARPLSFMKSINRLYNFGARPTLTCRSVASSNKFMHQITKPPEVTAIPSEPCGYIAPPPGSNFAWEFPRKFLLDTYKRPQPRTVLNVAPLAPLVINKYVSGRVFCWEHQIFFQVGGAARFKTLCDEIYSSVSKRGQPPRHLRLEEVCHLRRSQMVLCSEDLGDILFFREGGQEVVDNFGLPGVLYRARLLEDGAIPAAIRGYCKEKNWVQDRVPVELVDIGVTGYAHVEKLIPMPQSVAEIPAMAITIGLSQSEHSVTYPDEALLDGADGGGALEGCSEYVQDAVFMPDYIHPDDEHLPPEFGVGYFVHSGTCVRRVDGAVKFVMPKQNVESVPKLILELIRKNLPFKTKINW